MTTAATTLVVPHHPWLSQGDIFTKVPLVEAGVVKSAAVQSMTLAPAMLITHDCTIDKKKGRDQRSALEYLNFLPVQSVAALEQHEKDRAQRLRTNAAELEPLPALYLGEIEKLGESWVNLTRPFTLPAVLFQPSLKEFTAEETGDKADRRLVVDVHETRVAALDEPTLQLFRRKWSAHWTRFAPPA